MNRAVAEQAVAEAMNRVLEAEREAAGAIEAQARACEQLLEAARERRRRILERARGRAARVHAAATLLRDREIERLERQAREPERYVDARHGAVADAVRRLAIQLTSSDADRA